MEELMYELDYGRIYLRKLKDGNTEEVIATFDDREDMLIYIEENYKYAKLYWCK